MPSRRALLAAFSAAGTVGGVGVWQRRRIRRREELSTLDTARDVERQSEPETALLTVTPEHVAASYDRARKHVQRTLEYVDDDTPGHVERHVDRARERLDGTPPNEQPDDAARESALDTYQLAVASSATARGGVLDHERNSPSDELLEAYDALVAALDAADPKYPGERLTRTVVQCGEVDDLLASAAASERQAGDQIRDDEAGPVTWERVEVGRCRVADAQRLVEPLDGPDRSDALAAAFDALAEHTEATVDAVDFSYDEGTPNLASDIWMSVQFGGGPESAMENGRHAAAVRDGAERAMVATTLEAFTEYPSYRRLHDVDEPAPGDATEVLAAKRDAVDALADALAEVGDDPLGNLLLGDIVSTVERGNRQVDRLIEEVRSYDDDEWDKRRYHALLTYRGAALEADAVPRVVEIAEREGRNG